MDRALRLVTDGHGESPIRVRLLAADGVAAYGWRGGRVFVTQGLVDLLDDEELSAAIAHEIGHLLGGGSGGTVTGLRGCAGDAGLDAEVRADRLGIELLARHQIAPQAMTRMLAKVERVATLPPDCRKALRRRIELLRTAP